MKRLIAESKASMAQVKTPAEEDAAKLKELEGTLKAVRDAKACGKRLIAESKASMAQVKTPAEEDAAKLKELEGTLKAMKDAKASGKDPTSAIAGGNEGEK